MNHKNTSSVTLPVDTVVLTRAEYDAIKEQNWELKNELKRLRHFLELEGVILPDGLRQCL